MFSYLLSPYVLIPLTILLGIVALALITYKYIPNKTGRVCLVCGAHKHNAGTMWKCAKCDREVAE